MNTTVSDRYSEDEFTELLSDASDNASNDWEEDFVDGLKDKYEQYRSTMYLSIRQAEILERIANNT